MAKILGMIVVLGALVAGVFGSAAHLTVDGKAVQVGSDSTVCNTSTVEVVSYQLNDHEDPMNVPSITVKGFDADCDGARAGLRIDNGSGVPIAYSKDPNSASTWVTLNGTASTVYQFQMASPTNRLLGINVPADEIYKIHVWLEGDDTP